MRIVQFVASCFFLIFCSGCATNSMFPKNYDPSEGQGLIVFAAKKFDRGGGGWYVRKIDLQARSFSGEHLTGMTSIYLEMQTDPASSIFFVVMPGQIPGKTAARTYEPGHYALLVREYSFATGAMILHNYAEYSGFKCFNEKAPIFDVPAGKVTILPVEDMGISSEQLLAMFESARKAYPMLQGDAHVADVSKSIKFDVENGERDTCLKAKTFTMVE